MSVSLGSATRDRRIRPVRFIAATLVVGGIYDEFVKDDGPWGATDYGITLAGGFAVNYALKFTGGN